jgi:hypothetical protein
MKTGDKMQIKVGYPPKVSHKKGKVIAKAGDIVTLFASHIDVWIVELQNKDRISIPTVWLSQPKGS